MSGQSKAPRKQRGLSVRAGICLYVTACELVQGVTQVRVAVGGQSKRTAEAEGRENLDWEETMVRMASCEVAGLGFRV